MTDLGSRMFDRKSLLADHPHHRPLTHISDDRRLSQVTEPAKLRSVEVHRFRSCT